MPNVNEMMMKSVFMKHLLSKTFTTINSSIDAKLVLNVNHIKLCSKFINQGGHLTLG